MNHPVLVTLLSIYFGLNFLCALALHLHAERQAHLRHRPMDVIVHFVLLTLLGLPALLVVVADALFGGRQERGTPLKGAGARAA